MKLKNRLLFGGVALATMFSATACTDLLKETPRAQYTPDFFETPKGVENGIISLYAHLRGIYGGYFHSFAQIATDETTWGELQQSGEQGMDFNTDPGMDVFSIDACRASGLWDTAFPNINTASGIIKNGEKAGVDPSLVAEAYFFRGFDYFMLVTVFGGVPLDLGAGPLQFNETPKTTSVRNTVPEVYAAIFSDLEKAVADLPSVPRHKGAVTKTVARLYLSKAYLTFGWWLENPNDIPTYPAADRVDVNVIAAGSETELVFDRPVRTAQQYFQLAYDTAMDAINDPADDDHHGLMDSFYEVNWAANDRNKEMLLYADHKIDLIYGGMIGDPSGEGLDYASGRYPENYAVWFHTFNYAEVRAGDKAGQPVQRAASQETGRPWTRIAPPIGVFTETFAEKTLDSRYDATFVTTYYGNWHWNGAAAGSIDAETMIIANNEPVERGGAIFKFLPEDLPAGTVTYPTDAGQSNIGAGWMTDGSESAWVIEPKAISRFKYPGLWKMGPERTDRDGGIGQPNGASPRPYYIAKYSELYLLAAEAAVKAGRPADAAAQLKVLRARAGKWNYNNSLGGITVDEDFSAEMEAATPANPDIDYVLMERSRELYGEGYRWFDLTRTQKWGEPKFGGQYEINGTARFGTSPVTYTRSIPKYAYLRPIPQSQIDRMEMSAEELAAYQNPGYNQ